MLTELLTGEVAYCAQGVSFSGAFCLPLGAQIGFAAPFWMFAWVAIFEGLGVGISRDRRVRPLWFAVGIPLLLAPLVIGII